MSAEDGFTLSGAALAAHPEIDKLTAALSAPQAALRARLNAVVLDLVLLAVVSQLAVALARPGAGAPTRAGLFLVLQFAYFFLFELSGGQTIGKRRYHVLVTGADGSPPTAGQIAIRNAVRIADAFPYFYVSGLISLTRTGPARRQRLGDVAARTTVVLEPGARSPRTPDWLLPTLTLAAMVLSSAIILVTVNRARDGHSWSTPRGIAARAGFIGGCDRGRADLVATCECAFHRITSLPAYNSPDRFEALVPLVRRAVADHNPDELPPALVAAARSCAPPGA